jgi:hypothetical protein
MIDVPVVTPGVPDTHRTDRLFLIGLVTAVVIRAGLFVLSFGVLSPAVGYWLAGRLISGHADIADFGIAGLLLVAAIYGAGGQRSARYAYLMGVVFVCDNLAYGVGVALAYRGQDAPIGFPIALIGLQIPLVVIATALIRRGVGAHR